IVKSRYLQYDKKENKKVFECLAVASCWWLGMFLSTGGTPHSLNQSSVGKGDLQSTLLDEDKVTRPDLDLSAINGKCHSNSLCFTFFFFLKKGSDNLEGWQASQTLLLTYLRVKTERNLAKLEEDAEENLLMLCEEKERLQEKLCELKHELQLEEHEQALEDALDKQMELLTPLVTVCEKFKEQYKTFATSLDATRHELPVKNIHIEGDTLTYLDKLQKHLTVTQELLADIAPACAEENAEACTDLKEFKKVLEELDKELQRGYTKVQNLSFEVSKEVSLHNQRICEENHGLDTTFIILAFLILLFPAQIIFLSALFNLYFYLEMCVFPADGFTLVSASLSESML
uniref:HAUS augmin like complex subunit 8 n=1 Tax=Nothoprocta perdicaria TaxID=30464 RepID=A0A8C6ZR45_NOTPE